MPYIDSQDGSFNLLMTTYTNSHGGSNGGAGTGDGLAKTDPTPSLLYDARNKTSFLVRVYTLHTSDTRDELSGLIPKLIIRT